MLPYFSLFSVFCFFSHFFICTRALHSYLFLLCVFYFGSFVPVPVLKWDEIIQARPCRLGSMLESARAGQCPLLNSIRTRVHIYPCRSRMCALLACSFVYLYDFSLFVCLHVNDTHVIVALKVNAPKYMLCCKNIIY